ncbi:MAG: sigma-54 dependent transcriptional regulator [Phycisphaerales bacterium]|nr:sigma-54 dependent transcriptional regulator [Phycisphaerales bacterium]
MDLQSVKNRFNIIGNAPALLHALQTAVQVSQTDLTVLIIGESGVGKEVFSQVIHSLSNRKFKPFIAVNCGAIPEGTIDSELFGHEKGSFTGAVDARKGYFETVNDGTIFLDEVGEMPLGTQARLLRVLETGEFIRVGSSVVQKTNVRVIAATNRNLIEQSQRNKFREDLYYRLCTVPIRVPSLKDRKEDIYLLFRKFAYDFSEKYKAPTVTLDTDAITMLQNYHFPGNVRELKNIAEQISVLAPQKQITTDILKDFLPQQNQVLSLLPPTNDIHSGTSPVFQNEREILYQLFFDMKKDVTELKKMFLEILRNPSLTASTQKKIFEDTDDHLSMTDALDTIISNNSGDQSKVVKANMPTVVPYEKPVVITQLSDKYHGVDDHLNIETQEKNMIIKALQKHRFQKRKTAIELGISERTLYRKMITYKLENLKRIYKKNKNL